MKSIQTFFILKVWTRKLYQTRLNPIARILSKFEPNENPINHFLVFIFLSSKNVDKKTNMSHFEDNRTKIAEVEPNKVFTKVVF